MSGELGLRGFAECLVQRARKAARVILESLAQQVVEAPLVKWVSQAI